MDYRNALNKIPNIASLDAEEKEILFLVFEHVDDAVRDKAVAVLKQHPSLISVIISNFREKQKAFAQGGVKAVEDVAALDADMVGKIVQ